MSKYGYSRVFARCSGSKLSHFDEWVRIERECLFLYIHFSSSFCMAFFRMGHSIDLSGAAILTYLHNSHSSSHQRLMSSSQDSLPFLAEVSLDCASLLCFLCLVR